MSLHLHKKIQRLVLRMHSDADLILDALKQLEQQFKMLEITAEDERCIEKIREYTMRLKDDTKALETDDRFSMEKEDNKELLDKIRHDLRNHINSMIGYAEILLEAYEDKYQENILTQGQQILTQSKHILTSVSQIRSERALLNNNSAAFQIEEALTTRKYAALHLNDEEAETPELKGFKKHFSILIVDDIEENCEILAQQLLRMGYQNIQQVYSAFEAKEVLAKKKVNLILLDIDMPEVTGIDLLEELKHDIAKSNLMVVMVTGADTIENAIHCIRLGAEDFLTKPINIDMLRVRIGSCLKKKWFREVKKKYAERIEIERMRYEHLLGAIFPQMIVNELTSTGQVVARNYDKVVILFVDVVGFTSFCDTHPVEEAVKGIQEFSEICESAALKYNLQKIKTIGDGFLATAGMLTTHQNPVLDTISCALEILTCCKQSTLKWQARAGIDLGSVIGGIVGHRQYLFDVWGDSVNTAARVQGEAKPDKVCLTDRAWKEVAALCEGRALGAMKIRGKAMPIALVEFTRFLMN